MELKVWVEGIQRIVCGVTVQTSCQDVVFALAHATGKVGRFTLIERWRNNERLLAPQENPLKILLKWGEYANDVQFILQRSENKHQQQKNQQQMTKQLQQSLAQLSLKQQQQQPENIPTSNAGTAVNLHNDQQIIFKNLKNQEVQNSTNADDINNHKKSSGSSNINHENDKNRNAIVEDTQSPMEVRLSLAHERAQELRKRFGNQGSKPLDNVGIVKGIPQRGGDGSENSGLEHTSKSTADEQRVVRDNSSENDNVMVQPLQPRHEKSRSNPIELTESSGRSQQEREDLGSSSYQTSSNHDYATVDDNNFHKTLYGGNDRNNNHKHKNSCSNNIYQYLGVKNSKSSNEINLAEVRSALDRNVSSINKSNQGISHRITTLTTENTITSVTSTITPTTTVNSSNTTVTTPSHEMYGDKHHQSIPTISANGALVPPPYRNPPPPRNSPQQNQQHQQNPHSSGCMTGIGPNINGRNFLAPNESDYEFVDYEKISSGDHHKQLKVVPSTGEEVLINENVFQSVQYNELLQLIKLQRDKINTQQLEISKYDAEIIYFEAKERDQIQELEAISQEITMIDQLLRQGSEQLQTLQYVEEENELVKQQEKTLKSEIALLRSKLANCETELLQCKNKIRLLMDDIEIEQRSLNTKQNKRQNLERDFIIDMERIQGEIDQAVRNVDASTKTAESLKKEILMIENAIADKKRQLEQLINEMKEVNLQSLSVAASDEIKHLLEGSNRRIIGSPRQLENAVPTSKNPHGVWV